MSYKSSYQTRAEAAQVFSSMRKSCSVTGFILYLKLPMKNKLHGGFHGGMAVLDRASSEVGAHLTVSKNGTCAQQVSRCGTAGAADLLELAASPGRPMLLPLAEYDVRT